MIDSLVSLSSIRTIVTIAYECVLKCGLTCDSSDTITQRRWDRLQSKSRAWTGLDRFGDVHETTSWENGPAGYHMHNSCYITISFSVQLIKAKQRKQNGSDIAQCSSQASTSVMCGDVPEEPPPPKRLRSSVGSTWIMSSLTSTKSGHYRRS